MAGLVSSHAVTLTGLTASGRYYYRVTSADEAGATSTWPPVSNPAASAFASVTSSVWNAVPTPGTVDSGDTGAVEVGLKFRSTTNGYITGLRFYKAAANTGSHTATLWSSTGTVLARTTLASETVSGWQEALFDTPVSITSGPHM